MGITSKFVTVSSAAIGLAVFSQAPEFAQQYRQRIGGAIDELRIVVTDFDRDAKNSALSRDQALDQLVNAPVKFSRDRGKSMTRTVSRFETLGQQQQWIEDAHPFSRPLFVLRNPDEQLINNAWEIFEPGVPLTSSGFVWGGVGGLLFMILARFGIGGARAATKGRRDRKLIENIEADNPETGLETSQTEPSANIESDVESVSKIRRAITQARGIPEHMRVSPGRQSGVTYAKYSAAKPDGSVDDNGLELKATDKSGSIRNAG